MLKSSSSKNTKAVLAALREAVKAYEDFSEALERLESEHSRKLAQREKLEDAGGDVSTVASKIVTVDAELGVLSRRLEGEQPKLKGLAQGVINAAVSGLDVVGLYCTVKEAELRQAILKAILPFCKNNDEAIGMIERFSTVLVWNRKRDQLAAGLDGENWDDAVNDIESLLEEAAKSDLTMPARRR